MTKGFTKDVQGKNQHIITTGIKKTLKIVLLLSYVNLSFTPTWAMMSEEQARLFKKTSNPLISNNLSRPLNDPLTNPVNHPSTTSILGNQPQQEINYFNKSTVLKEEIDFSRIRDPKEGFDKIVRKFNYFLAQDNLKRVGLFMLLMSVWLEELPDDDYYKIKDDLKNYLAWLESIKRNNYEVDGKIVKSNFFNLMIHKISHELKEIERKEKKGFCRICFYKVIL